MPETSFLNRHNLDLMRAALPYMKPQVQKSIEIISKADELMAAIDSPEPEEGLSAASLGNAAFDLEAMLSQIRSIGTPKEQEQIDTLLNFMKMQKLLQGYRTFLNAKQKSEHASGNFSSGGSSSGASAKSQGDNHAPEGSNLFGSSNDTLMEFLMSQLSPDQKSSFDSMNMMFQAMPKSGPASNPQPSANQTN